MHTPQALRAQRGKLRAALRRRFDGADVFVLGYGGWNDLVFSTLAEVVAEDKFDAPPEVLWAFFDSDERCIRTRQAHVFGAFAGPLARCQVTFYWGVDAHRDLLDVVPAVPLLGASASRAAVGAEEMPHPGVPEPSDKALLVFQLQVSALRRAIELVYRIRNAAREFDTFVRAGGALSESNPTLERAKGIVLEAAKLEQTLYENRALLPPDIFSALHQARHQAEALANCIAVASRMLDGAAEYDGEKWLVVRGIIAEEFPELTATYERLVQVVQNFIGVSDTPRLPGAERGRGDG